MKVSPLRPEPCLRCGETEPITDAHPREELFVYTARLRLVSEYRIDIDTKEPTMAGRVCEVCTLAVIAFVRARPR